MATYSPYPSSSTYSDILHPAAPAPPLGANTLTGTAAPYQSLLGQYNQVPQPRGGQGAYGLVPGPTSIPPSVYSQTTAADPGLTAGNDQINANIMSELQGQLSPQVLQNMQNLYASYAGRSGMPGSNAVPGSLINNANLLGNILTTQDIQARGLKDYQNQEGLVAGQQLNPALISSINQENALLAAAPDPTTAALTALNNYYAALNAARGPGGGTRGPSLSPAGGTGQEGAGALGFPFGSTFPPGVGTRSGSQITPPVSSADVGSAIDYGTQNITDFLNQLLDLGPSSTGFAGSSGLGTGAGLLSPGAVDTGTQFNPVGTDEFGNPIDTGSGFNPIDPNSFDYMYG